ncbi:MAG: HDIG domain-containing protein [Synergistaceae bacterium]|nr:HDIG domain-containing protein [Synergistaceae bacterium]
MRNGSFIFLVMIRFALVLCAVAIALARWYFVDTGENYMVGFPSPRTYTARVATRFVDRALTSEARHTAADQIVNVRVRNRRATQLVTARIADLKNEGDLSFAPPSLEEIVTAMSDDVRIAVINTVVEIAEKNYDKSVTRSEQSAMIWDNLRNVDLPQAEKNVIVQLLDSLLIPTVIEDSEMTERLREDMASSIPLFTRDIGIGYTLVQQGQVVTPEMAVLLRENGYPDATIPWKYFGFVAMMTFGWSMWLISTGLHQETPLSRREWIYVVTVTLIYWIAQNVPSGWDFNSMAIIALSGWLFLSLPKAFAFHVVLGGGLIGYILAFPGINSMIAVGCIVCAVAAGSSFFFISEASSRIKIWANVFNLGICLTLTSYFVRWGLGLPLTYTSFFARRGLEADASLENILLNFLLGVVLSVWWSSAVVAFISLWEYIFDIISPLRLLELSHPSQPLMKRLQLEAPGTFHHTVAVGTLAEAVADRLDMNGLLIKAGAYYHDIGKLKRPHYFVENQSFGDNIHDRLAPGDSARMLLSHVPDGLKLADEYKLPGRIKDFIAEHHGTTSLVYFYQKAVTADKEAGGEGSSVDEDDFCYKGPVPQSPETALLMLADSVDAALKSLNNPLSERAEIERLIEDVTNSKIMSGQFVNVDYTLKDINAIKNAMVDVLMSMYHTREIMPLKQDEENTMTSTSNAPTAPKAAGETNGETGA